MKSSVVVASALALLTSGCLFGRPNPKIDKLETDGLETSFKYDDDGFPTDVERDYGGGDTGEWELKWENGLLVKVTFSGEGQDTEAEIEYDDAGRPETITASEDGSDATTELEFKYDDQGRLEGYTLVSENPNLDFTQEMEIEIQYADNGAFEEVVSKQTVGDQTYKSTIAYEFDGARLQKSTNENEGSTTETEYAYDDDGRVEGWESKTEYDGEPTGGSTETEVSYGDDGLVESWEQVTRYEGGESDPVETEISYGEGDARGLDMTPNAFGIFFDLKGGAYDRPADLKMQVSRFLLNW